MTQQQAANDPTLQALAHAIRDENYNEALAERAFDDRCEELGFRFGDRVSRALFMIACRIEAFPAGDPPTPFDDLPF